MEHTQSSYKLPNIPHGTIEGESILHITKATDIATGVISEIHGWFKLLNDSKQSSSKHHRIGAPAIMTPDGVELWYVDDVYYIPTAHEKMMWELRKKNEAAT